MECLLNEGTKFVSWLDVYLAIRLPAFCATKALVKKIGDGGFVMIFRLREERDKTVPSQRLFLQRLVWDLTKRLDNRQSHGFTGDHRSVVTDVHFSEECNIRLPDGLTCVVLFHKGAPMCR